MDQKPVSLITGVTGLLGANLALAVSARGPFWGLSRNGIGGGATSRICTVDISDPVGVLEVMRRLRPTVVYHCAAETRVDHCEAEPEHARRINVLGTRQVARAAAAVNAVFVYVSTDSVFDGARGGYSESDEPNPVNVYAETKLEGERATREETGDYLIARVNFYGWNLKPKQSLSEWVLGRLREGQTVPGFTDVHFSPLNAFHLASSILELTERGHRGLFHLGSPEPISKFEFARLLANEFGLDASRVQPKSIEESALAAKRPKSSWLKVGKAELALGRALPGVGEGVKELARQEKVRHVDQLRSVFQDAAS